MSKVCKITHGYVIQTYEGPNCVHQEFFAGDVEYANADHKGRALDPIKGPIPGEKYQMLDMVQPHSPEMLAQLKERLYDHTSGYDVDELLGLIRKMMDEMSQQSLQSVIRSCTHFSECQRCGSDLDTDLRCTDETCPFSDTDQDDERGWAGHPERDKL